MNTETKTLTIDKGVEVVVTYSYPDYEPGDFDTPSYGGISYLEVDTITYNGADVTDLLKTIYIDSIHDRIINPSIYKL